MNLKRVKTLYRKELLDIFRDKKSVIMMILIPIVLYPCIFLGAMQVMMMIQNHKEEIVYQVATDIPKEQEAIEQCQKEIDSEYQLEFVSVPNMQEALEQEEIDAYITKTDGDTPTYQICYISSVTNSVTASQLLENLLEQYKDHISSQRIREAGLEEALILQPITVEKEDQASNDQSIGYLLGMIVPFMLIISIMMGTMYPAIDVTAGERERGTQETLLTLPVRNDELITGKFLAVATIAVISALLNMLSMGGVAFYMSTTLKEFMPEMEITVTKFLPILGIAALCIIVFALLISAIMMCICAFAKSYKEANNYITPVMLVCLLASYVGFIPNMTLDDKLSAVPVVNIVLLIRDLFAFKYNMMLIAVVLLSNVVYAAIAIWALSKIYDSEAVLFGEGQGGFTIFENRKNIQAGGIPSLADGILIMLVTILAVIYLGGMAQIKLGIGGIVITQLLLVGIPIAVSYYSKHSFKEVFRLTLPSGKSVLGSLLLMSGVFVLVLLLGNWLITLVPSDNQALEESFGAMLGDISFVPAFLVVACLPAICEELLFRGFFLSSVRTKLGAAWSIVIVAAVFGVYHMSFVKFFTTGILGIALAYSVYKSKSILTSMLMHAANNGLLVTAMYFPEKVERILPFVVKESLSSAEIAACLVIGVLFAGLGIVVLELCPKREKATKNETFFVPKR